MTDEKRDCKKCGGELYTDDPICPECGADNPNYTPPSKTLKNAAPPPAGANMRNPPRTKKNADSPNYAPPKTYRDASARGREYAPSYGQNDRDYNPIYERRRPNATGAHEAFVCSLIGLIGQFFFFWTFYVSFITLALGIVGLVWAQNAKKRGLVGGQTTAAQVLGILTVVFASIMIFLFLLALLAVITLFGMKGVK